jgi:hypothetical protein
MADDRLDQDAAPSALAQWQALFQEKLAQGYSHLNAIESIAREYPGLGQAATAEQARQPQPSPNSTGAGHYRAVTRHRAVRRPRP